MRQLAVTLCCLVALAGGRMAGTSRASGGESAAPPVISRSATSSVSGGESAAPSAIARSFYIDYASGNDANSGTSPSSPWKTAPGMQGFAGRYAHQPGDRFFFKGGVTWPRSEFPLVATGSGTPGNDDYYGAEPTWYSGSSFSPPVFDAGGSNITGNGGQDMFLNLIGKDDIEVNDIHFAGFTGHGLTAYGSCAGIDIDSQGFSGDQNIVINAVSFSGMSIDQTSDTSAQCAAIAAYSGSPWAGNSIVENSTFTGGNTTLGTAISCVGNVVNNVISGMTGNIYPCGHGAISGNTIADCGYPNFPAGATGIHADAIQTNASDGAFYIFDNVIAGTGADGHGNECESMFLGNPGETDYVFDNVLFDLYGDSPALTQAAAPGNAAYFWNNTIVGGFGGGQACLRQGHGDPPITVWENNLCISSAGSSVAPGAFTSTQDHNVLLTPSQASADGLTASEIYPYLPTSASAPTVGAGANLTSECAGPLVALCTTTSFAGWLPTSPRPRSGPWDAGAASMPAAIGRAPGRAPAQGMAVPAFFHPGRFWTQIDRSHSGIQIVVVNPHDGPGRARSRRYARAFGAAQAAGMTVVGYVDTRDGQRAPAAVESQIDAYRRWYHVNGIFFDHASTDCAREPYYAALSRYVRQRIPAARTILAPRGQTRRCYMRAADVLLTFEGSDQEYLHAYSAPPWVADYPPSRFWHVIYRARTVSAMAYAVWLSRRRGAGFVYATGDGPPAPYARLPTGSYWTSELAAIAGVG